MVTNNLKENTNWAALSLTRFVLAFVVMVWHLKEFADITSLQWLYNMGSFEAVLGFLLISGFSIGISISNNKEHFFKRRLQRIYPVYLACIALTVAIAGFHLNIPGIATLIANLFFLNQVVTEVSYIPAAWSLSLEVWLYCLAPLLLKLKKNQLLYLIRFSFLCYVLYTCGRTLFNWRYYAGIPFGLNLLLLSFIWLAGFNKATSYNKKQSNAIIGLLLLGIAGLTIAIQTAYRIKNHHIDLLVTDLPVFLGKAICLAIPYFTLVHNAKIPPFKPAFTKIANLLGNVSYPLYLSHAITFVFLRKMQVTNTSVYIITALVVATVLYYIFDFYSRKRRRTY